MRSACRALRETLNGATARAYAGAETGAAHANHVVGLARARLAPLAPLRESAAHLRARRADDVADASRRRRGCHVDVESRRRRGRDADIPWSRGDAAAAA